ncbi:FAD-dependent oxidoreductase [Siphonobacter sp. SORGH_AS_1065]|uniref:FAD-dependent oxidoreductase n=1 Tax=Siphonobacter sp. SORGH_AS_1065 TaxID=3041795 RepID=UPI002780E0E7|nr:FAD-dependent oxidoreductase [Siphonobacter sp. SORGH_AS_1065]MDQ1085474.1 ribulose 1,5-bisphosphate synthetase/thiazole synthase [Siphonobacter sp. SORGH_AS_1065]
MKIITLFFLLSSSLLYAQKQVDICIYGGTSGGVMAAVAAKRLGKSVLLIEPGQHLGGMTSGGLGLTDIGNKYAITGLSLHFYRRLGQHYGPFEQWIFEPHVAEDLYKTYVKEDKVDVVYGYRIQSAKKNKTTLEEITLETASGGQTQRIRAKMFMDCSYEGDLMAKAGVSYRVGREANADYKETYNGVQLLDGHQFPDGIDPYKEPGKPESGLLWGISPEKLAARGEGDRKVQAYNYRICLTKNPNNRVAITKPDDYDPSRYELVLRLMQKKPWRTLNDGFIWSNMPNEKTDINNRNGFSTDMIGMNYEYPEASYEKRAEIIRQHENYTKGLLYFIGNDPRVSASIREQMQQWGYPKDEYTDNNHWSPQLYIREARRMVGDYVMTQANCEGKETVTDGVGLAAYTMDSHNCQRIVIEKDGKQMVKNEGNVEVGGFAPYPISYRSLIPKASECTNLLVPVCMSATHIAYGSIRMEPVFMVLGQSAAVAASMAIDRKTSVQAIDGRNIQKLLLKDPLLNGSAADVVVDDAQSSDVQITGDWTQEKAGSYAHSLLSTQSKAPAAVRFTPTLPATQAYQVYVYVPRRKDASSQTVFRVYDGSQTQTVHLNKEQVIVEGQTSGAWIPLGTFKLPAGKKAYVEITNEKADGAVVADAVQFVQAK